MSQLSLLDDYEYDMMNARRIAGKPGADDAKDLSDATLEAMLRHCAAARRLIPAAKRLRDIGLLTMEMVNSQPSKD